MKNFEDVDIINKRNSGGMWMDINFEMPKLNLNIQESSSSDNLHIYKPKKIMTISLAYLKFIFNDNAIKPENAV